MTSSPSPLRTKDAISDRFTLIVLLFMFDEELVQAFKGFRRIVGSVEVVTLGDECSDLITCTLEAARGE